MCFSQHSISMEQLYCTIHEWSDEHLSVNPCGGCCQIIVSHRFKHVAMDLADAWLQLKSDRVMLFLCGHHIKWLIMNRFIWWPHKITYSYDCLLVMSCLIIGDWPVTESSPKMCRFLMWNLTQGNISRSKSHHSWWSDLVKCGHKVRRNWKTSYLMIFKLWKYCLREASTRGWHNLKVLFLLTYLCGYLSITVRSPLLCPANSLPVYLCVLYSLREETFWRNYFYRVSLVKQSVQLTSLAKYSGNVVICF